MRSRLSLPKLALRGLAFHWRVHCAVALGALVGTAVLTGALLVGDSVRGSLRHLALDRLGRVEAVLITQRLFRAELASELEQLPEFAPFERALPVILLSGSVANADTGARANQVTLLGTSDDFGIADSASNQWPALGEHEILLNQPLADDLRAKLGDEVLVRLPLVSNVPRDSPLARKTDTIENRRLRVVGIVPAQGMGHFSLAPNQQEPRCAFLSLDMLQQALDEPGRVNALLVVGRQSQERQTTSDGRASRAAIATLQAALRPSLADLGLHAVRSPLGYTNVTSDRMLIEPAVVRAAQTQLAQWQPQRVLTYLANDLRAGPEGQGRIPYSTIAALDLQAEPPLGPLVSLAGEPITHLADDAILLNRWAYEDLARQGVELQTGDRVRLTYFEPESTHGQVREQTVELTLAGIVELAGPAADRDLTPEVKGLTDEESIANWNPPFPYDPGRVRSTPPNDQDEQYWKAYRATPKGFVTLATGERLWSSRFGNTTSIRLTGDTATPEAVAEHWQLSSAALGFELLDVRGRAIEASSGTTPFDGLFLGFSMFLIASAVALVMLLFRLGIERRVREIGILLACGISRARVRRLLLIEGGTVAALAAALGVAAGVGYAQLMLWGLRTWWLDAVGVPMLFLYITPRSLLLGYLLGACVALAAVAWAMRLLRPLVVRNLLAQQLEAAASDAGQDGAGASMTSGARRSAGRWPRVRPLLKAGVLLGALGASLAGVGLGDLAQAGAFFAAGFLVLVGLLMLFGERLRSQHRVLLVRPGSWPLVRLAGRNASRNPSRSTLSVALVAAATFLIVAISAFRIEPPEAALRRESGTGGYTLLAESDQPLYHDLGSEEGRFELGFSDADETLLMPVEVMSLRLASGEDASCRNLYQTSRPRVLGLPRAMLERGGFVWASSAAETPEERANPWLLLDKPLEPDADGVQPIPVVIDLATAVYSLHLPSRPGARYTIEDGRGEQLTLQVVGLLQNSILQGSLLVAEAELLRHFPETSGYRFFLLDTASESAANRLPAGDDKSPSVAPAGELPTASSPGAADPSEVALVLERTLGELGLAATPTSARLAEYLAVQNTYLATFQSLGGLGLLLGTLGLAVVQLRSVIERRGELALLRAAGFRQSRLARLVVLESATLLVAGMGIGLVAALVATLPHLVGGGATIPWPMLAATLALVLVCGLSGALLAVRMMVREPLLAALREQS